MIFLEKPCVVQLSSMLNCLIFLMYPPCYSRSTITRKLSAEPHLEWNINRLHLQLSAATVLNVWWAKDLPMYLHAAACRCIPFQKFFHHGLSGGVSSREYIWTEYLILFSSNIRVWDLLVLQWTDGECPTGKYHEPPFGLYSPHHQSTIGLRVAPLYSFQWPLLRVNSSA